jgi:hypothetical protein
MGAVVIPTVSLPKLTGEGDIVISVPLPLKAIVCGLMQALSTSESAAERAPSAPGVNATLIPHFAPAAKLEPQELEVIVKSLAFVPVSVKPLVMVIATVPALVRVKVNGELAVLIRVLGKASVAGEKAVCGAPL